MQAFPYSACNIYSERLGEEVHNLSTISNAKCLDYCTVFTCFSYCRSSRPSCKHRYITCKRVIYLCCKPIEMGGRSQYDCTKTESERIFRTRTGAPHCEPSNHYTTELMDFDDSIEEDRNGDIMMSDMQVPVKGRYIIMLDNGVSDWHLDESIRIMEEANYNSTERTLGG